MRRTLGSILIDIVLVIIVIIGVILCIRVSKSRTTKEENIHNSNDQKLSMLVDQEENDEVVEIEEETKEETKEENSNSNKTNTTKKETTKSTNSTTTNKSTTNKSTSQNTTTKKSTEVKNETVVEKNEVVVKEEVKQPEVKEEKKVTQQDVINFFDKLENEIITSENIEKARVKVKSTFIKVTDFIFYGTEINGYTFNGLTDDMKVRVLNFAAELDSHIESRFPGYKDTIKTEYNNFVIKLSTKYKDVESKVCTKIGTQTCENARLGLQLTADLIKSVTKSGLEALKTWYEKYRLTN